MLFLCAISSLKNRFVTGQNRFLKYAPFVEHLIKQKADTIIESDNKAKESDNNPVDITNKKMFCRKVVPERIRFYRSWERTCGLRASKSIDREFKLECFVDRGRNS